MKKITQRLIILSLFLMIPFCLKVSASTQMMHVMDDFEEGTSGWTLIGSTDKSKIERVTEADNFFINLSFQGDTGSDLNAQKYFSQIALEGKTIEVKLRVDNAQVTYAPILLVDSDNNKVELATIKTSSGKPYIKVGGEAVLNPMPTDTWVTLGIEFVSQNQVNVYINGEKKFDDVQVANLEKMKNISQLRIYSKRAEGKECNLDFDDFKIFSYKEEIEIIVNDDFDDGQLPSSWKKYGNGGDLTVEVEDKAGYLNMLVENASGVTLTAAKGLDKAIAVDNTVIEMKVTPNRDDFYTPLLDIRSDGNKERAGEVIVLKSGGIYFNGEKTANITTDQCVRLAIEIDKDKKVNFYMDDAKVREGITIDNINNLSNIKQINISSKGQANKDYQLKIDDFRVYKGKYDVNETNFKEDINPSEPEPPFEFIVSGEDVISDLLKANPNNNHPRILIDESKINELKAARNTNVRVKEWTESVIEQADEILDKPVSKYEIPDGRRLNSSKDIKKYIEITGMAYLLTEDQVYLDRAVKEIEAAINFPDWNDSREFLNTATIMSAMAIAYDWFYDDLDNDLKTKMRKAMIEKGLNKGIEQINNKAWWSVNAELINNWNAVCNSGIIMAALAIGDEEQEVSSKALERAITSFGKGIITEFGPDGSWGEGPTYWQYAMEFISLGLGTLNSALGQDYDISKVDGLRETAHYIAYVSGPQGIFNYGDSPSGVLKLRIPQLFYLGQLLDDEEITQLGLKMLDDSKKKGGVYDLIWYDTSVTSKDIDLALDAKFRDPDLALMRGSWVDPLSTFVGFKAGKAYMSHGHMDAGNFVFHANGEQWTIDIGTDNYVSGYFEYDTDRYHFYRTRPDGHNTFVINPDDQYQQDYKANNEIKTFESNENSAFAIADLSPAYSRHVNSAQRGVMLTSFREAMIVQDQVDMKVPSDYYWFMHTGASIDIQADGKEAILTQNGKRLLVKIIHGEGTFTEMEAKPLPGTPDPLEGPNPPKLKDNTGIKKLVVELKDVSNVDLAVALVPLYSDEDRDRIPAYTPLDQWKLTEGDMVKPELTNIFIDSKPLEGFDSQVKSYTYTVPYRTTDLPKVTAEASDKFNVEVIQADNIVTPIEIKVTDKENSQIRAHYTIQLTTESLEQLPKGAEELEIVSVEASDYQDPNKPANTLDDDLNTRWSAQGEQWIKYDLGDVKEINIVGIAFSKGNQRSSIFDIEVSEDGVTWKKVLNSRSNGISLDFEYFTFLAEKARYIRINGKGNTGNDWNSYTGVKVYEQVEVQEKPEKSFTISNGSMDRSTGIKVDVSVVPTEGTEPHADNEVVIFQLMKDTTPINIVAVEMDITTKETFSAYFNVLDPENQAYTVEVFLFDQFNIKGEAPESLSNKLKLK